MDGWPPLQIEVWTKDYTRVGPITEPREVSGFIAWNGPGSFEFSAPSDNARTPALAADGARAVVTYRPDPAADSTVLLSGPVTEITGQGPTDSATRKFHIADDWAILNEIIGWPSPAAAITAQSTDAYYRSAGPAETVTKAVVAANATRQGVTVTIPTSEGRGGNVDCTFRMHPLTDRLFPAVDLAGIGVRVVQIGAERVLQIIEPVTRSRVITEGSGAIVDGSFQLTAPTVTRVVVGAGGEDVARVFREYIDTTLEAQYGISRCKFVDARDVDPADPSLAATLQKRADEALAEGAPKVSLSVELAETNTFRFGKTFDLGDRVSVQLSGSPVLSDLVREVRFEWTEDDGLKITPVVGNWDESTDDSLYRSVASLSRAVRDQQRR